MKQARTFFLAAFIAFPVWAGGDSSDGHSHAAPAPVPMTASTPRAAAASEAFEVVVALEGKKLVLYVDHFASNEPLTKAKVEVDGAGLKGFASEIAPGTYVMDIGTAVPAARHPLTVGIETDDSADLLSATLDTSLSAPAAAHVYGRDEWLVWIVAALLLAGAALLAVRRNRKSKRP